ncbi:MAG TPA: ABC transporter substrate-binding protein [Egibacteraceae bacterium]|nr:ABC transporter substrate-binding protein [Egibacteraceae bacterium]
MPSPRNSSDPLTPTGLPHLSRRSLLQGMLYGGAGLAAVPILSACGDGNGGTAAETGGEAGETGGAATGTVTLGSNASDEAPKNAGAAVYEQFTQDTGIEVTVNTVDHGTFQEQINTYLQGTPEDVFTWFAGYRMQFFAARGLSNPITDLWGDIGADYSQAMKDASTGEDGEQYFVPFLAYPWAVFYRKSLFEDNGYTIPTTYDDYVALAQGMQDDGLTPLAFADKDGWPAMGTFDYMNMRLNGYDFHIDLMAGKESWEDDRVKEVFNTWAELLPLHQEGALGRTWQEAAQSFHAKDAGMFVFGMFVGQQFPAEDLEDLDFFPFPEMNPDFGQGAVEAPIDGYMLSKEPKNRDAAIELLRFLATPEAQGIYLAADPTNIAAVNGADTSTYNELQLKAEELIGNAEAISQFLDRDTRPDFSTTVVVPSLQNFINNPGDVDNLLRQMEEQKQAIFVEDE